MATGIMNRSSFAKALWPGVNAWYGKAYNEYPTEWDKLFDYNKSSRAFEEDVGMAGFGLANVKTEGDGITYDTERQGFVTRYTHVTYALGFIITEEMVDDDLYDVIGKRRAEAVAFSMRQTKEILGANIYNNAFSGTQVGGDGVSMINAAHPNVTGGTWSNQVASPVDISEASLEQAFIDIAALKNDRGLQISLIPKKLIIHPTEEFNVTRILKSSLRVGTANNDLNALKETGKFSDGWIINHYLTDPDAWFIQTNAPHGMKYWERKGDSFGMDNDFDSGNAKFKASARYSFGWTDPRAIYGSPGV